MPQVPVDLAGIAVGKTLIWDGTKLVPGNRVAGSAPRTAGSIAGLGPGAFDGEQAIVRVGVYPNVHEEPVFWSLAQTRWIGEEHVLVTQGDTWAMDLGNRSGAQLLDWSAVDNPVPFGKSFASLTAAPDLSSAAFAGGTGVLTVDDTTSPHSAPFTDSSDAASYLRIRDNYLTHTGRTGTTLTGCTLVQGTGGVIPAGEYVAQGWTGGWGFSAVSLAFAAELVAAGLGLQERLMALMNSSPLDHKLTIAPYWFQYDPGDGTAPPTIPPTGGLGVSAGLTSLDGTGDTGGAERAFTLTVNDWTDWPLADPTKHFLIPRIVGKMAAGSEMSGECLDTRLAVRWAS